GHPALEVVTPDGRQAEAEPSEEKSTRPATTVAARGGRRSAMAVQQMAAVRKHTEQLLQRNQQLRQELSSLCLASATIPGGASPGSGFGAGGVVSLARLASPEEFEVYRTENKPARPPHPHLVLVPGKE